MIEDSLLTVRNDLFLKSFKKRFVERNSTISSEKFKQLDNHDNPLHHLRRIFHKTQGESPLIVDLIRLSSDKIQLVAYEILQGKKTLCRVELF